MSTTVLHVPVLRRESVLGVSFSTVAILKFLVSVSWVLYVMSCGTLEHLQEAQSLTHAQHSPLATFLPLPYPDPDPVFLHSLPMGAVGAKHAGQKLE